MSNWLQSPPLFLGTYPLMGEQCPFSLFPQTCFGCSRGECRVLTHNQHSLYSAHCSVTTAAVSGVRLLLARGITYNQSSTSSSSSVATVVSSPADQSLRSTRHLWMSLLCGCKRQPRHTLVMPPLLQLLILSFHCSLFSPSLCLQPLARLQLPISTFMICLGIYTCRPLFPGHLALYFTRFACWFINKVVSSGNTQWYISNVLFLLTVQCLKSLWNFFCLLAVCSQEEWKMRFKDM